MAVLLCLLSFYYTDPVLTAMVTPTAYTGKDIEPFNSFTLSCTGTKPSGVLPPLQLSWYRDGMQLDTTVSTVTVTEDSSSDMERSSVLNVTSAAVLDSGEYTCSVAVTIPESDTIVVNQSAAITISGMYNTNLHSPLVKQVIQKGRVERDLTSNCTGILMVEAAACVQIK